MAALYDGDDNRVFTASRKEGKNTYQIFQGKPKDAKSGCKSPYTAPSGGRELTFLVWLQSKYPETAQHIEDAIKNEQLSILTIDRENAKLNKH